MINIDFSEMTRGYMNACGKKANSYEPWFNFYKDFLLSESLKFFSWECGDVPQKEIEMRLIILGKCGINYLDTLDGLTACDINLHGSTRYYDEWEKYNYVCPLESGERTINVDGIVVDNNALRIPTFPIINRYAMILAHLRVSLICACINGRSNVAFICNTQKQAEGIRSYRNGLYNGKNEAIVDSEFLGVETREMNTTQSMTITEINDIIKDTLLSFYKDMGVPNVHVKKERLLTNEIEFENVLPKLNMKDAFDMRKKACERINNLFGVNWSVKCNVEYEESEVKKDNEN